jgi:hypothetical protein
MDPSDGFYKSTNKAAEMSAGKITAMSVKKIP